VGQCDTYLLHRSLPSLLSADITFKRAWIANASAAVSMAR
jgi:hypothetical protein